MSYFSYCVSWVADAVSTVFNAVSTSGEEHKPPSDDQWEVLEPQSPAEQEVEENDPNYVCPSIDYDFVRDHNSYIVVSNHVHGCHFYSEIYVETDK